VEKFGNILVCVDGSDYMEPSIQHACWLGERVDADELVVAHISDTGQYQVPFVNELGAGIGLQPCNGLFGEIHKQEQDRLDDLSKRVKIAFQDSAFAERYRFGVWSGRPIDVLSSPKVAYSHVVFGKRGDSFSDRKDHLGANIGKFLKAVSVPCMLSSRAFKDITDVAIVCAPDSAWQSVIKFFLHHSGLHSLNLHILHSWEDSMPQAMKDAISELASLRIAHTLTIMEKNIEKSVVEYVNGNSCNLLALGASKKTGFFDGNPVPVAKSIVKRCRVPIVICRG
jgi:nucleotide-binding universal stress UspA family protein